MLEVILAIAILATSMAVIGELLRIGSRSAKDARELSQAQILCQSKLAELTAGISPVQPVDFMRLEFDPEWLYSVEIAPVETHEGLLAVRVSVMRNVPAAYSPVAFSLVRWIRDPTLEFPAEPSEETSDVETEGTGKTDGAGTSTPSSGGSGSTGVIGAIPSGGRGGLGPGAGGGRGGQVPGFGGGAGRGGFGPGGGRGGAGGARGGNGGGRGAVGPGGFGPGAGGAGGGPSRGGAGGRSPAPFGPGGR